MTRIKNAQGPRYRNDVAFHRVAYNYSVNMYIIYLHKIYIIWLPSLVRIFISSSAFAFIYSTGVRGAPLLQVLARGTPLASHERDTLIPLLSTFCATLTAVLSTLHDSEFLGDQGIYFCHMWNVYQYYPTAEVMTWTCRYRY